MKKLFMCIFIFTVAAKLSYAGIAKYDRSEELFPENEENWMISYSLIVSSNYYGRWMAQQDANTDAFDTYSNHFYKTYHEISGEIFGFAFSRINLNLLTDYITSELADKKSRDISNNVFGIVYQFTPISIKSEKGRRHEFGFSLEYSKSYWKDRNATIVYRDEVNPYDMNLAEHVDFSHKLDVTNITPAVNYWYIINSGNLYGYLGLRFGYGYYTEEQDVATTLYDDPHCNVSPYVHVNHPKQRTAIRNTFKSEGPMCGLTCYIEGSSGFFFLSDFNIMMGNDGTYKTSYYSASSNDLNVMRGLANFGIGLRSKNNYKILLSMNYDIANHKVIPTNHLTNYDNRPDHRANQEYRTSAITLSILKYF
jgi:hypothetical protein